MLLTIFGLRRKMFFDF
ncbi:hypothetical protein LPA65_00195 [Lactiplantibacillus argentoratensis]|uniref:Uncharacterized protein n=1 Tax=Lactiplantibacillus argentoratensis TaxID=271881 RepID=A0AAN1Q498_9LACO|nr:hypothetical protein LPA65_00195 [Lactiplantibacillus argentoratensis]